jgi:hypothetical protein
MPVIQMGLASDTLSEQALFDVGNHFIRTQLATVQGTALPCPYGGKQRLISVDLDTTRLQATGLTPLDIVTAIGSKESCYRHPGPGTRVAVQRRDHIVAYPRSPDPAGTSAPVAATSRG